MHDHYVLISLQQITLYFYPPLLSALVVRLKDDSDIKGLLLASTDHLSNNSSFLTICLMIILLEQLYDSPAANS